MRAAILDSITKMCKMMYLCTFNLWSMTYHTPRIDYIYYLLTLKKSIWQNLQRKSVCVNHKSAFNKLGLKLCASLFSDSNTIYRKKCTLHSILLTLKNISGIFIDIDWFYTCIPAMTLVKFHISIPNDLIYYLHKV